MFRKRRDPNETQGFNRINQLIEDRQRELAADPDDDLSADTILMNQPPEEVVPQPRNQPPPMAQVSEDDETVSLLSVRGVAPSSYEPLHDDREAELEQEAPPLRYGQEAIAQQPVESLSRAYEPRYTTEPTSYRYAEPPPVAAPTMMPIPDLRSATSATLIAAEATWEGKLHSEGDVRVEGVLRGEIETAAMLVVAPHARVHGTINARSILLGGDVEGDINCEERLEILPGGSARGQINSGTLVVHEGAYIDSRFRMRREQTDADDGG